MKKGNWIVALSILLVLLSKALLVFLKFLPSPIAQTLADSFSVSFITVGVLMSVCTVASGFSPILASVLVDYLGSLRTWSIGLLCSCTGMLVGVFLQNFYLLAAAYILHGIAVGFSVCLLPVFVSQWIAPRFHSLAMSINLAMHNLFVYLAYILPGYMMETVGSWRGIVLLFAVCEGIAAICLLFLSLKSESAESVHGQSPKRKKHFSVSQMGIVRAVRHKRVLVLTAIMTCFIWCNNTTSTYFPIYLTTNMSINAQQAGAITAFISTMSIAGALAIGLSGKRAWRTGLILLPILSMVGGLGMYLVRDTQAVMALSGLFGFAYQGWIPLAVSALLAIPNADSAQLAGATALFDGTGHILTLLIPWSVGVLGSKWSLQQSMVLLQLPLLAAAILTFLCKRIISQEERKHGVRCADVS